MKTLSSKPSITGQQFELDELLATNKSLAQEKRQVHRQKLRQYSEKAVKLKDILKTSIDSSQRKCLQSKLKALQQKQDMEITKLAKIDQIQKQIDQYMTQEDQQNNPKQEKQSEKLRQKTLFDKKYQYSGAQNTPAKRLKQRNNYPLREINQTEQANSLERSTNSNYFCNSSAFKVRQSSDKKAFVVNETNDFRQKLNEIQDKKTNNPKQSRTYSCWQPTKTNFQRAKLTNTINNQVKHFIAGPRQQTNYEPQSKFSKEYYIKNEQQKLSNIMLSRKESQQRLQQIQKRINDLIDKQRQLMARLDNYEKEEAIMAKKTNNFINSIHRSKDIILSSGLVLQQLSQMQINNKSSHQFSIDSLESNPASQGSFGLSIQLGSIEKMLQQFLLCAQREVMLTSGQLQQCGLKVNRLRDECSAYETKKRNLQTQNLKLQQSIPLKRKQISMLAQQYTQIQQQNEQFEHFAQLKKKLVAQLEEKCDKLKCKKKLLTEKVQKLLNELKIMQQSYSNLLQNSKQASSALEIMKFQQKQLEETMIFTERQIQKCKNQKKQHEKQLAKLQSKIFQMNSNQQKIVSELNQNQKRLVEIQSQLTNHSAEQNTLHEKIRKIERQLSETTTILDEQRSVIANQNDQINTRSNQLLEWQKKIIAIADSHRAIQAQNIKLSQSIRKNKQQMQELKAEKQKVFAAKVELEEILSQVITKKETLMSQVDLRSSELQTLISDLMEGHQQLKSTSQKYEQIGQQLKKHNEQYTQLSSRLQSIKEELEEKMQQEVNIIGRINKIKLVQKQLLLELGLKGTTNKLDQQLKSKVSEAIQQLQIINKLKVQLKQCKYQNRKLKLDHQRLCKLFSTQNDSSQHI